MNRILSRSGRKCIKYRQNFFDAPKLSLTLTAQNFTKLKIAERHYVRLFCTEFDPGWSVNTGNACKHLFQACKWRHRTDFHETDSSSTTFCKSFHFEFNANFYRRYSRWYPITDGRTDGLTSPHNRLVLYFVKNAWLIVASSAFLPLPWFKLAVAVVCIRHLQNSTGRTSSLGARS
jgi:hypothetical protein